MRLDQKGHGDYGAIGMLLLLFAIGLCLVEGIFVAATIVLWKHMVWRIIFGALAVGWAAYFISLVWR